MTTSRPFTGRTIRGHGLWGCTDDARVRWCCPRGDVGIRAEAASVSFQAEEPEEPPRGIDDRKAAAVLLSELLERVADGRAGCDRASFQAAERARRSAKRARGGEVAPLDRREQDARSVNDEGEVHVVVAKHLLHVAPRRARGEELGMAQHRVEHAHTVEIATGAARLQCRFRRV